MLKTLYTRWEQLVQEECALIRSKSKSLTRSIHIILRPRPAVIVSISWEQAVQRSDQSNDTDKSKEILACQRV